MTMPMPMPLPAPKRRRDSGGVSPESSHGWKGPDPYSTAPPTDAGSGGGPTIGFGGGGGTGSREGRGLPELMNELLGSWPGAPLAAAGTACSRVGEAVGDEHATDGFLAGLLWWSLAQSGYVRQL